jgi:hypothetical protein
MDDLNQFELPTEQIETSAAITEVMHRAFPDARVPTRAASQQGTETRAWDSATIFHQ